MNNPERRHRRRVFLVAPVLAGAILLAGALPAAASYDGDWSVTIWTARGHCDRGYKYEVRVREGTVSLREQGPAAVSGNVDKRGAVSVSISAGDQRADGTGRLAKDYGEGTWTGRSSAGVCSGTWEAERR